MSDVGRPAVSANPAPRLHQPWRLVVALGELLLAGLAIWGSFGCWAAALTTVMVRLDSGVELVSRTYAGDWMAASIGLGTAAAVLAVDAARQSVLGIGRRRRRRPGPRSEGLADGH